MGRTTPRAFDYSIVRSAISLVGKGSIAIIKSTILPGTTKELQKKFPDRYIVHSPEFLVLKQAAEDAARPLRNIIGIPKNTKVFRERARMVMKILPHAPFEMICTAEEAELIKYTGNFFLYMKILYANLMFEAAKVVGANYEIVRKGISADPRIGPSHLQVLHGSGHPGARRGRGAGGVCFIKDISAFTGFYETLTHDEYGVQLMQAAIAKNLDLLVNSHKDLDLLEGVHGRAAIERHMSIKKR